MKRNIQGQDIVWNARGEIGNVSEKRRALIGIIESLGVRRLPEPVQLASGDWSSEFIDAKRALAHGADLALACEVLIEMAAANDVEFDAVGGLTLGADQFSHGVAVLKPCNWFVVRKVAKGRGTNQRIEGAEIGPGIRVLLVDDVVTRGGSIKEAYEVVRATGATVSGAMTLLDRGGHADEFFASEGVAYEAVATYRDLGIDPVGGESDPHG